MIKTDVPTETDRPAVQRLPAALLLTILGLFLLGAVCGVAAVMIAKGMPPAGKEWVFAIPLVCLPLGIVCLRKAWLLAAPPGDASQYERRYWKMWMWVVALGMPLGAGLAFPIIRTGKPGFNPITNTPIDPTLAVVVVILGVALLTAAILIYHRTIDEQEERGYLWGSQVAYYYLSLALPAWWILQRGGLLPALGIGAAMALLIVSFVIQGAIWAWFKFR